MKWTNRIGIMIMLSACMAIGLSLLPRLEQSLPAANDFRTGRAAVKLTEHNLVDFMVELPLQLRIRKVDISHSILSIDLNLPKNAEEVSVYRDLYAIVQSSIAKTSNVNQILVRVMDYSGAVNGSAAQLVLAMIADREKSGDMKALPQEISAVALEQQLKARFRLTYTPKWHQRYPL